MWWSVTMWVSCPPTRCLTSWPEPASTPPEAIDDAPSLTTAKALECQFLSFDEETELLLGEIINVSAEEYILGEDGKIDPAKLRPISFDRSITTIWPWERRWAAAFQDGKRLK